MDAENFNNNINTVYDNLNAGDTIGASMIAEEILTDCFSEWRKTQTEETAMELIAAACAHSRVLLCQERLQEAYATCLTVAAYTAVIKVEPSARLSLYLITWNVLEKILSNTKPQDNSKALTAVNNIVQSLGTLLYHYYYATGRAFPDDPALNETYECLKVITQLVEIKQHDIDEKMLLKSILQNSEEIGLIQ